MMFSNNYNNLHNKLHNQPSFRGGVKPVPISAEDLKQLTKIVDGKFNGLATNLTDRIKKIAPEMLEDIGGIDFVKDSKRFQNLAESLAYPFLEGLSRLLPEWKPGFLQKHRVFQANNAYIRAARGLQEYGAKFIKKAADEFAGADEIKEAVGDKFQKLFAENLSSLRPKYGTREERAGVRLITGIIPALFLGNDFYNKALRDGATGEEAEKEAAGKRGQEVLSNVGEAYAQFALLGGFPGFVNSSQIGAPLINTGIGVVFAALSRVFKGMPLTKVKIKEKQESKFSIDNFIQSLSKTKNASTENEPKKNKKPLLTPKNIALACAASIAIGMGLKFGIQGLSRTKFGNFFKDKADKFKDWFDSKTMSDVIMSREELENMYKTLEKSGHIETANYYRGVFAGILEKTGDESVNLGRYHKKIVNILGVRLTSRELYKIPLAPFKLVTEIVGFPYKAVSAILGQLGVKEFAKKPPSRNLHEGAIEFVLDYKRQSKRYMDTMGDSFFEFYKKHLDQNIMRTLDKDGYSKIDNAKMGKITQLLGTGTSLYFAMTDDYNRTAKRTGNKALAERDAKERGINKFMRIISQAALIDIFNQTFKIPYMQSLLGAYVISGATTFATEKVSRILSGMPSQKMQTKEELAEYKKQKLNGPLGKYYKAIDRLAE